MSALPQNNNPEINAMFYDMQNIPRRSHPPGCPTPNNKRVNTCNIPTQYGNIHQDGQQQNPQLYNNIQQPMMNCVPLQHSFQNQNTQTIPTGAHQHMYPLQNPQPVYNRPATLFQPNLTNNANNTFSPFIGNPQPYGLPNISPELGPLNAHPTMQTPYNNVQPVGAPPFYSNVASPAYSVPVPTIPVWNVNPWNNSSPIGQNMFQQPAYNSFFTFPRETFHPNNNMRNLPSTSHALSPKPLGKLLFPTIFDFKHGSFFKMLIHMSGFEAKNINISANRNSIELRAIKEEIEKQVKDFSGYILKQVARIYYFPEPIEESKIQISVSEDGIGILIPWKQNAC